MTTRIFFVQTMKDLNTWSVPLHSFVLIPWSTIPQLRDELKAYCIANVTKLCLCPDFSGAYVGAFALLAFQALSRKSDNVEKENL